MNCHSTSLALLYTTRVSSTCLQSPDGVCYVVASVAKAVKVAFILLHVIMMVQNTQRQRGNLAQVISSYRALLVFRLQRHMMFAFMSTMGACSALFLDLICAKLRILRYLVLARSLFPGIAWRRRCRWMEMPCYGSILTTMLHISTLSEIHLQGQPVSALKAGLGWDLRERSGNANMSK